jgi:hypothetical protein
MTNMSGVTDPELHICCEDEFSATLISHALTAEQRRRCRIIGVGSKTELAKQFVFYERAGFRHHILLVWDGDVNRNDARQWVRDAIRNTTQGDRKPNCDFLPGHCSPERFVLEELNQDHGWRALADEIQTSEVEAQGIVQQLLALQNPHDTCFQLGQITQIADGLAADILAKCCARLPSQPLAAVREAVADILEGRHVDREGITPVPHQSPL